MFIVFFMVQNEVKDSLAVFKYVAYSQNIYNVVNT